MVPPMKARCAVPSSPIIRNAERAAHRAARAVDPEQVARLDLTALAGRHLLDVGEDAVLLPLRRIAAASRNGSAHPAAAPHSAAARAPARSAKPCWAIPASASRNRGGGAGRIRARRTASHRRSRAPRRPACPRSAARRRCRGAGNAPSSARWCCCTWGAAWSRGSPSPAPPARRASELDGGGEPHRPAPDDQDEGFGVHCRTALGGFRKPDAAKRSRGFHHRLLDRKAFRRGASDIAVQTRLGLKKSFEIGRSFDRRRRDRSQADRKISQDNASRIAAARPSAASCSSTVLEPIVPPELLPKWMMILSTPASAMARASSGRAAECLGEQPHARCLSSSTSTSRANPMPVSSRSLRNLPSISATVGQFITPS